MRIASMGAALALLVLPTIVAGFSAPPPGKSGPPVVPYRCDDGREAEVVYESGSNYLHAKALVTIDGRTIEMRSAPTLYGVRYRTTEGAEPPLAWSVRGEGAWLTESPDPDGYAGEERALASCVRTRGTAAAVGAAGHSDDH